MVRSSILLTSAVTRTLRGRGCTMSVTGSKRLNCRRTSANVCSVIVLSLVLPGVGNCRILSTLHESKSGIPMLVLSTGARVSSGVRKFAANTSSCVAGPFRVHRLLVHVRTVDEHDGRRSASRPIIKGLSCSPTAYRVYGARARGSIRMSKGRVRLLRFFVGGYGRILRGGRVAAGV